MNPSHEKQTVFFGTRAISPPWDEGSKNMVYGLAQNLEEFEVTLLTYRNARPFPIPKNVKLLPVFPKSSLMMVSLKQKLAFLWAVLTTKADVYHFFFCPEQMTARVLRWVKLLKKGVFIQTIPTPFESLADPPKNLFGDWVVVQSQHSLKKLIAMGDQEAICIYPGIDSKKIQNEIYAKNPKELFNLSHESKVILYPGHYYLGCNKDLIDLVRAKKNRYPKMTFIFACRIASERDEKLKEEIKAALREEIDSGLLILLDNVDSILTLISRADVVIFPPRIMTKKSEIPLALLEALALRKPIVITDIPPLNEIMKRNVGEIIPAGNSPALIQAIDKLLENPQLTQSKGELGQRMVREEFDIRQAAKNYAWLYKKSLKNRSQ